MDDFSLALALGVLASGLFSGILAAVLFLLQRVLKGLDARDFTRVMQGFLPLARKAPINLILTLASVLAPAAALLLGREDAGRLTWVLTLAGMLVFLAGPFLLSRYAAEPLYDVILGWGVQSPPADWRVVRERYFRINRLRTASSWLAFLLLVLALTLPR
ncbi:hypothetical protein F0U61_42600 [Archangium violaceum]|uniref:hypothetical protein n=1 Tax=Archangium violaceum TaxID=83451 RepID=UPI002B2A1182|nr:hypothetical protein F0U61_42600 [Archangium violaceum]